jgi:hypothetical protein
LKAGFEESALWSCEAAFFDLALAWQWDASSFLPMQQAIVELAAETRTSGTSVAKNDKATTNASSRTNTKRAIRPAA